MIKTKEDSQHKLIQFQEAESLSMIDSVELFLYENAFSILLSSLGLLIALTIWISCSI